VPETLSALPGVSDHTSEPVNGRVRVSLEAAGDHELRPEIFRLATEHGWVLWELRRERASLEQLFHELTMDEPEEDEPEKDQPEKDQPEEDDES